MIPSDEKEATARGGRLRIDIPPEAVAPGAGMKFLVRATNRPDAHVRVLSQDKGHMDIQFVDPTGVPITEDLPVRYLLNIVSVPSTKNILRREPFVPPTIATTFSFEVFGGDFLFEFGYIPPGLNPDSLEEGSVEVHTKLMLNGDLTEKLYLALKGFYEATPLSQAEK